MAGFGTARLVLREWTEAPGDLDRLFDIYSRWEVARWLGVRPKVMADRSEAVAMVERMRAYHADGEPFGMWAVEVRGTGVLAGTVLFKRLPNSDGSPPVDVEVGWHLHPDSWGCGYATEAARAAVERGFAAGVDEVYAVVYPGNARSVAVTRRLGMTPIGTTDRWYGTTLEAFVLRGDDGTPAGRPSA